MWESPSNNFSQKQKSGFATGLHQVQIIGF